MPGIGVTLINLRLTDRGTRPLAGLFLRLNERQPGTMLEIAFFSILRLRSMRLLRLID